MNAEIKIYEPLAGLHIAQACKELCQHARDACAPVCMTFNDIAIEALPGDLPEAVANRWSELFEERRQSYLMSDEYRERQAERTATAKRQQKLVSTLIEYKRFESLESTLLWLERFTPAADHSDVNFNRQELIDALEAAGYVENEGVGQKERIERDRIAMGRYIVGQAITCLKHGMPPHPITVTFIERWKLSN